MPLDKLNLLRRFYSSVTNDPFSLQQITLLSARGMIVHSDDETWDDDEISSEEATQKVVDSEEANDKLVPSVAAQVEVLYDVEETVEVPIMDDLRELENKSEDNAQQETKTVTRTSVVVGVFEAWLSGGDNPEEGMRWKLADLRHPFEFPFITSLGMREQ